MLRELVCSLRLLKSALPCFTKTIISHQPSYFADKQYDDDDDDVNNGNTLN